MQDPISLIYSSLQSEKALFKLVEEFYAEVEKDPLLRPMYPEDLSGPKERLALFLIQRTGGRTTYSDQRGHPRMRARHMPFTIGQKERDAWMKNMSAAVSRVPELEDFKDDLLEFFESFSTFMINHV